MARIGRIMGMGLPSLPVSWEGRQPAPATGSAWQIHSNVQGNSNGFSYFPQ